MNELIRKTAVLVLSCDKYQDLWNPFFSFFSKYWDDCPFKVYLGTNFIEYCNPQVTTLKSNIISTWSAEVLIILDQIKEEYLIIILDDYFIYQSVDNNKLLYLISVMIQEHSGYMKISSFPQKYNGLWPYTPLKQNKEIGEISPEAKYRVDLQIGIWQKDLLKSLINKKESPWEFEINASIRSRSINRPFLILKENPKMKIVHGPITYYCTAISRGKWMRGAIKLCKSENVEIDLFERKTETIFEEYWRWLYIKMPIWMRKIVDFIKFRLFKIQ